MDPSMQAALRIQALIRNARSHEDENPWPGVWTRVLDRELDIEVESPTEPNLLLLSLFSIKFKPEGVSASVIASDSRSQTPTPMSKSRTTPQDHGTETYSNPDGGFTITRAIGVFDGENLVLRRCDLVVGVGSKTTYESVAQVTENRIQEVFDEDLAVQDLVSITAVGDQWLYQEHRRPGSTSTIKCTDLQENLEAMGWMEVGTSDSTEKLLMIKKRLREWNLDVWERVVGAGAVVGIEMKGGSEGDGGEIVGW